MTDEPVVDELITLRRANPTSPEVLEQAVAMDRATLLEMLAADAEAADAAGAADTGGSAADSAASRYRYVGAMAVAAAALTVIALIGAGRSRVARESVDPADSDASVVSVPAEDNEAARPQVSVAVPDRTDDAVADDGRHGRESTGPESSGVQSEGQDRTGDAGQPATDPPMSTASSPEVDPTPVEFQPSPVPETALLDPATDLLAVHFDHSHLDDGHAAAAARELATWYGLTPHVVSGTAPADITFPVHSFETVMTRIWGDAWLDARSDRSRAVSETAARWLATIDGGGRVWVAEGGVSDFTAEVVRRIIEERPAVDTVSAIRVVQHIDRNEMATGPDNLQLVLANTSYIRIDDGNGQNDTAGLNQPSTTLVDLATTGRHADGWAVAFEHLPAERLDFSDTVAVLHILGVTTDEVLNPTDFANRFMG
ncbi:MAG: hypothetical protein AAGA65_13615 [Actinomycetota bacterium]